MQNEIRLRFSSSSRKYHKMRSTLPPLIEIKIKLYIAYLWPIIMYTYETWVTTKGDELKLLIFEREILKKIYGQIFKSKVRNLKGKMKILKACSISQTYKHF